MAYDGQHIGIDNLRNVSIINIQNLDILQYDNVTRQWLNKSSSSLTTTVSKHITFVIALNVDATIGINKTNAIIIPEAGTITKCYIYAKTAPVGSDLIADININGVSVWSVNPVNRITLFEGNDDGTSVLFDNVAVIEGDIVTVDIDQVGSITPGSGITIELTYTT